MAARRGVTSTPKRVEERLRKGLRRYQPIVGTALSKDLNEADTVKVVTEVLSEVFGYDKFEEVTSEHAIRGSFCDLAVVIDGKLEILLEVKAVGLGLKDAHTKQAVNYAASQGTEWVVLTNGVVWKIYHVNFAKPVSEELVAEFNLLSLDPKNPADIERLFLLTKEGTRKSVLDEYHSQRQVLNRFTLAAIVLSPPVMTAIRREVKRLAPGAKVDVTDIEAVLRQEVIKREVIEGERAERATKSVSKMISRQARVSTDKKRGGEKREALIGKGEPTEEPRVGSSDDPIQDSLLGFSDGLWV